MDKLYCTKNIELSELLHNIGDGICLTDNSMVFVAANQRLADFYGKEAKDLVGKSVFEFYPDFKNSVFFEASEHTLKTGEPATRIGFSNNLKKWLVVRTFKYNEFYGVMCIHELKTGFDKRCYVGNYDSLTSLYNRFSFEEDLHRLYSMNKNFGIVILDINKFKQINESFHFEIGDRCLMEIAARLKQIIPKRVVYRLGADQFAIIFEDSKSACINDIRQIFTIFNDSFIFNGDEFKLTCAIGFNYIVKIATPNANFTNNITTQKECDLINNTEFALARSKKLMNTYIEYDENLDKNTYKLQLVKDLKKAIVNKELEVFYQPQIDTLSGKVCGAEALIRWRHPEKGLVPPNEFLPAAEEYNLIEEIDMFGLLQAVSDIKAYSASNIPMSISVNFSAQTICSAKTVPVIKRYLEQSGIDPSLLVIEITETSLMEDLTRSKDIIQQISMLGVHIALDDFGTGYSSMGYLMRYPTNYLKIDKEFITDINSDEALKIVTGNLIKLGHSLSMTIVAEGVETQAELAVLQDFGCDVIQGFYYSKPLPRKDFGSFVNTKGFSSLKSSII